MILAAQLFSFEDLLPFAFFGMFAALAWWLLEFLAAGKSRAVERLDELKNPRARRSKADVSALKKQDAMTKVLEKATPALAKPLQPKSDTERGKLKGLARAATTTTSFNVRALRPQYCIISGMACMSAPT